MKRQIETTAILPVMPVSIIATQGDGTINFAPHGQIGTVTAEPSVVYTSVIKEHQTARNILKNRRFSVNIPSAELLEKVRICGNLSGTDTNKAGLFETFEAHGVPIIQDCSICFACEVIQQIELNGFYVFLAQVVATYADEACLEQGWPVPTKVNPLLCSIDGKFWTVGAEQAIPPRCQSCGLPFDETHRELNAKEKDGSDSPFCSYCYQDGAFLNPDATVKEMVDMGVPHLARKIGEQAAREQLRLLVPALARWQKPRG